MKPKAYAKAGVDIALGNQLKTSLPKLLQSTRRPEVLGAVGGFGGLFQLSAKRFRRPVLVSSMDGVGTKLKVAFAANRHDTIGEDLVNHCVNDTAVLGAEPLFFLDYLGAGRLQPAVFEKIIVGLANGCRANGCALIGGETAQMPGFYQNKEYDLCGAIVGIAEKSAIPDGKTIRPGDIVIGFPSNGLHTNGYTLARQVFFEKMKLRPNSRVKELGNALADELLRIHRSYLKPIRKLLARFNPSRAPKQIKGFAHITGGGLIGNLPRILPPNTSAQIAKTNWEIPSIFSLIQKEGQISEKEMFAVFNMGIGLVAVVSAKTAAAILAYLKRIREPAFIIGEIIPGNRLCKIH